MLRSSAAAASTPSVPPAVVFTAIDDDELDGCSSSDDGGIMATEPNLLYVSEDSSYRDGKSNDISKKGWKPYQNRRSLVDQLRLCFLRGQLSRLLVWGTIILAVGIASYVSAAKVLPSLLREQQLELQPRPIMIGFYFTDVQSYSFTGRVDRLEPPKNNQEWFDMLGSRLQNRRRNQKHHHRHHHNSEQHVIPVEPMSKRLDSIDEGSSFYEEEKPEITPNDEECTPQYNWQTAVFPVCNTVHESGPAGDRLFLVPPSITTTTSREHKHHQQQRRKLHSHDGHHHHNDHDHGHGHHHSNSGLRRSRRLLEKIKSTTAAAVTTTSTTQSKQQFKVLAHGYWRDTWMMQTTNDLVAFKTMRMHHELTEYLMDKQRRDAVTSDRMTFSNQAIKMYGACGTSAVYEYAPGGDLKELVKGFDSPQDFTQYYSTAERLLLAYNITCALNDLHTTEGPNSSPAIVHGDFKSDQFVAVTPVEKDPEEPHKLPHFKLGDFNLARFVYFNEKYNHPCVIKPDGNGGKNRAPEEYAKEKGRTEKLDIYSLGNVLYTILTGHFPFDDLDASEGTKEVKKLVQKGRRPHVNIDADIRHSKDPLERSLLDAVEMCWKQDPHDRASAAEVEAVLARHLPKDFVRHPRRPVKDMRRHLHN